jgi:hypothetical protein
LLEFLDATPLTESIAALEFALEDRSAEEIAEVLHRHAVDNELLGAALAVREQFGRINDLIHAVAISLALPHLLQPGGQLRRPSLGSGNDPSRPYDVESNRRIAEFKFSRWQGHDAQRKRQVFAALVHLAAAPRDGRLVELYVLGSRPARFLMEPPRRRGGPSTEVRRRRAICSCNGLGSSARPSRSSSRERPRMYASSISRL